MLNGSPNQGQSLEEVKDLMISQVELIKSGEFEDWMLDAVINDMKLTLTRQYENNTALADAYVDAFIYNQNWADEIAFIEELKEINKEDLVAFANEFYGDNYVVVYKRKGVDENIVKVANPGITPVNLNRGSQSDFVKTFSSKISPDLKPKYVDYKSELNTSELTNGIPVTFIDNPNNDLFELNIIFDMGKDNQKDLEIAAGYFNYIGTDKYSPEELKKEFYKLGIDYGVSAGGERTYVYISGLKENLKAGLALLEEAWSNATGDQDSFDKYIARILKGRQNTKLQKGSILQSGLMSYALYGEDSSLRNIYQADELMEMTPTDLTDIIKSLKDYKQRIFYYGKDVDAALTAMNELHMVKSELLEYPEAKDYDMRETGEEVYFTNYDMVQAELMLVAKEDVFDPKKNGFCSRIQHLFWFWSVFHRFPRNQRS